MKSVEEQLSRYKSVHFNKKNIKTHFVGIPLIIFSITILMSLQTFQLALFGSSVSITIAMVFFSCALIYYFILHWRLALGMLLYVVPNLYLASLVAPVKGAYLIAIGIFVIGWIIQFIGHYYEKAKPAFVDDFNQLLIGPLFLMAEVYFALGWEDKLNQAIIPMAREKRRALEAEKK